MKRFILVTLGMMVLLATLTIIPGVAAFEFDNVVSYSEDNKTVYFENLFGFGKTIARAELTSHTDPKIPRKVFPGENRTVMIYETENYGDLYPDFIKNVEFTNMNTGQKKTREYHVKYAVYDTRQRQIRTTNCLAPRILANGSSYEECTRGVDQFEETYIREWKDFTTRDAPEGNITIGLQVDVAPGEYYDGVFEMYGEKVSRHATWNSSFNVDLLAYWKFDNATGTPTETNDSVGLHNAHATVNGATFGVEGIIGQAYKYDGDTDFINISTNASLLFAPENFTVSLWFRINTSRTTANAALFTWGTAGGNEYINWLGDGVSNPGNNPETWHAGNGDTLTTNPSPVNIEWWHMVAVENGTGTKLYINGTLVDSTTHSVNIPAQAGDTCFGIRRCSTTQLSDWLGEIDEAAIWNRTVDANEVADLYNGGVGISFTTGTPPSINLISPDDFANQTNPEVAFEANATDDTEIVNMTLFIDGIANFTRTGDGTNFLNLNISVNLSEGSHLWEIRALDDIGPPLFSGNRTITIDTTAPTITLVLPESNDIINQLDNIALNFSVSDATTGVDSCTFSLDGGTTNTTITDCINTTFSGTGLVDHNIVLFANDTAGNENFVTANFTLVNITQDFLQQTVETKTESYTLDLTISENVSVSTAFFYNGTSLSGITNTTRDFFNVSQQLPLIAGSETSVNNTINWSTTFFFNTNNRTLDGLFEQQEVNRMIFELCDGDPNVAYLNFSFQNETVAGEVVTAAVDSSTFVFSTFDATKNRSLTFSSVTENANYTFCFSPEDTPVTTTILFKYSNSESEQRTFTSTAILTNVTLNQLLFLLPTVDGLFTSYQTVLPSGESIEGVLGRVQRTIGGTLETIASALTDAAGLVTFFLDPDESYLFTFSKTGLADNIFTLVPNQAQIYIVTMGSGAPTGSFTSISSNFSYIIQQQNASLTNNTDFDFSFNVTEKSEITNFFFNITNSTGDVLLSVNGTGGGFINGSLNTENFTRLIGYFTIESANESVTIVKLWTVGDFFQGEYSLDRQLRLYLDYDFSDFIRILIVLAILMGLIIYMSTEETIDTTENKLVVAGLIIWTFSFVGWLDTGVAAVSATGQIAALSQFANQYGIAILFSAYAASYIGRRLLRNI